MSSEVQIMVYDFCLQFLYSDKRKLKNKYYFYFSTKPYLVTIHLNRLFKTIQMNVHNIEFMLRIINKF